jgi:hypothetical protein
MPAAHENPMSVSDCPVENTLQMIDEFETLFPKGLDRTYILKAAPAQYPDMWFMENF